MTGSQNFWDIQVWSFVVVLAVLFSSLMLANALRRKIGFLRKSLIPSSVLAGFIVLFVDWIYKSVVGQSMFNLLTLEALTYHGLGLGVVAMSLRSTEKLAGKKGDVLNTGLTTVTSYMIQAIVGITISLALFYAIGSYAAAGILLPMGFGQGPGQAYNWGHIYETYTQYPAFENGTSFGLSVAALGFIAASAGGVLHLNHMRKQGKIDPSIINADEMEDLSAETITQEGEIPLSESLDKLTAQFGLIFIAYGLAFAAMWYMSKGFDALGGFFENTVKPLIWGFNFLFGLLGALLVKVVLKALKKSGVAKRQYTNNFLLNRISGLMFDIMVVASIAAIDLSAFRHTEFIVPLLLICGAGAVATYFYIRFVCRKLFKDYQDEEFLGMYGMLTGTASTGLILLREIDPLYETPAATNLIYQNLWAIVFGFPVLLLMGFVARSLTWTWLTLAILVALMVILSVVLFRSYIFKKKDRRQ